MRFDFTEDVLAEYEFNTSIEDIFRQAQKEYNNLTDAEKAELAWIKQQVGKEEYKKLQDRVGVMRRTQQKREERRG